MQLSLEIYLAVTEITVPVGIFFSCEAVSHQYISKLRTLVALIQVTHDVNLLQQQPRSDIMEHLVLGTCGSNRNDIRPRDMSLSEF